jgi:hypothetical protein
MRKEPEREIDMSLTTPPSVRELQVAYVKAKRNLWPIASTPYDKIYRQTCCRGSGAAAVPTVER